MRIGIATPQIAPGDAVSNDVLGMQSVLTELGAEVRLFADRSLLASLPADPPSDVPGFLRSPSDVFIYHHSVGWDDGLDVLRRLKCRKVVKYHNVTPPGFFRGLADHYAAACEHGRAQLTGLVELQADLYLADSSYNLSELGPLGTGEAAGRVVPPFHQIERLHEAAPNESLLNRLKDGKTNLLNVGRVVPNKGQKFLIEAFAAYFHGFDPRSRLLLVGKEDPAMDAYSRALRTAATRLGVADHVEFLGEVDESELAAAYQAADLFITASLHEGFCVPLVESMALKIPIAAIGFAAVPETTGPAGIVWRESDPVLLAASVDRINRDPVLREKLGLLGWRRYQDRFTNEQIRRRFLNALEECCLLAPQPSGHRRL